MITQKSNINIQKRMDTGMDADWIWRQEDEFKRYLRRRITIFGDEFIEMGSFATVCQV